MADYFSHPTAIIDDGANIGSDTKVWHWTHVCANALIGKNCVLGQNVFIGGKAIIGNGVKIQNNVSVYNNVTLEDDVFCGPSMVFTNVTNPRANIERKDEFKNTLIKKGATLGANCTILCGATVGEYALIGAGAVITKNVKPHALITGVPGVQTGWVSHSGEVMGSDLTCPRTDNEYEIDANENLVLKVNNETRINK